MKQAQYYTYQICRTLLGLILCSSAIGKLLDNRGFAAVIETYQFGFPQWAYLPMGLLISLLELWLGIRLFRRIDQKLNAQLCIGVHAAYTLLALITLQRGIALTNCGCFGVFWARPLTYTTVVEDLILTAMSCLFYFWRPRSK